MINPVRPSVRFILGQISFHEAGEVWYRAHDQASMAAWSQGLVEEWRAKLQTMYPEYIKQEQSAGRWVN